MRRFNDNLKARQIVLSKDSKYMLHSMVVKKLTKLPVYAHLSKEIQEILISNVLIVATTDSIKRIDNKVDTIIGNINESIELVMKDVHDNSEEVLLGT